MVPRNFIRERRQIIHAVNDGHILVKIQMLAQFLETAVQIANVGHSIQNTLTIQRQHQSQSRVRRWVLRTEVERPNVFTLA